MLDTGAGTAKSVRVASRDLVRFATSVLERIGVPSSDARAVADCLVWADLPGIDSHGVARLPVYVQRLRAGVVNRSAQVRIERIAAGLLSVDGDNGLGLAVGMTAMQHTIAAAPRSGPGLRSSPPQQPLRGRRVLCRSRRAGGVYRRGHVERPAEHGALGRA